MVERFRPKRFQPKLISKRRQAVQQNQQILRIKTNSDITDLEKRRVALTFDNFFSKMPFSTIQQTKDEYNKIDPSLRKYMKFNIQDLESKQQDNIKKTQSNIEFSSIKAKKEAKRGDKINRDDYRARVKAYSEALVRLQRGEIIPLKNINSYAMEKGDIARTKRKSKISKKEARKKISDIALKSGAEISKIDYSKGTAVIGGKVIRIPQERIKKLKLTSQKRAEQKKDLSIINKKIQSRKSLSVSDFEKAREIGIKSSDLLKAVSKVYNISKKIQQNQINFIKNINPIFKAFSDNEIRKIVQSEILTTKRPTKLVLSNLAKPENFNIKKVETLTDVKIPINIKQKIQQQQTISSDIEQYEKRLKEKYDKNLIKGFSFDIRGLENIKRGLKGERLIETPFGYQVAKKDGTIRQLKLSEMKELQGSDSITLNPLNFVTGFFGFAKDAGYFSRNLIADPKRTYNEVSQGIVKFITSPGNLDLLLREAVKDPFGFAGEAYGFGKLTQGVKIVATKPIKVLKKINQGQINNIRQGIKILEEKGVNIRDRTPNGAKLRLLNEELDILQKDLIDLNKAINSADRIKIKNKSNVKKLKSTIKKTSRDLNKRSSKRIKLIKKKKKLGIKINSDTSGKLLKELFEEPKLKIKITKKLPIEVSKLEKLLIQARKESGQAFSKLKKKIKKEFGLNVVERKVKGEIGYKLLEPKKQKKKGIETKRKEKVFLVTEGGKIIRADKMPKAKIKEIIPKKEKLNKKDLKDLEFKEGQNLDKIQKDIKRIIKKKEFFSNKKAQAKLSFNTRKFYKKAIKKSKEANKQIEKFIKRYHPNKSKKPTNPRTKNMLDWSKDDILKYKKARKQIINLAKKQLKNIKKLNIVLGIGVLKALGLLKLLGKSFSSSLAKSNLQALEQEMILESITIQINDFEIPTPKKPKKPGVKIPRKKIIKKQPIIRPLKPVKPIKPKPKKPKPKIKTRILPKEPTKKRLLNIKLPDPKLKPKIEIVLLFEGIYRERRNKSKKFNKRTNPVITKKMKFRSTPNKALNKVMSLVDNSATRSLELKVVGITNRKIKDVKLNKIIDKFRIKKLKSNVLKLVEKTPYIRDTIGEVKEISPKRKPKSIIKNKKNNKVKSKNKKNITKKKLRKPVKVVNKIKAVKNNKKSSRIASKKAIKGHKKGRANKKK